MNNEAVAHAHPTHCLNCGAAVHAHFCQHCGQETAAHVPSAGEFLHEFVGHYIALENKLWKTLALLLFKPGRLTREYLEGKRVRYVQPLRVYLTMSIIFFAVFKYSGHDKDPEAPQPQARAGQKAQQTAKTEQELAVAQAELEAAKKTAGVVGAPVIAAGQAALDLAKAAGDGDEDSGGNKDDIPTTHADNDKKSEITYRLASKDDLGKFLHGVHPKLGAKYDKFLAMDGEERNHMLKAGFFAWLPYAIFAMMPVFALHLKLLYLGSGRLYGEHLLFALHTNAFAFLMLTLLMVAPSGIPYLQWALVLWLAFYLPTAMRKVYGGSRKVTLVRWIVLMTLHWIGLLLAVAGAGALAFLA